MAVFHSFLVSVSGYSWVRMFFIPTIFVHGICGYAFRVAWGMCLVASPIIMKSIVTAHVAFVSLQNSSNVRSFMKSSTSFMALRMSSSRVWCLLSYVYRLLEDFVFDSVF